MSMSDGGAMESRGREYRVALRALEHVASLHVLNLRSEIIQPLQVTSGYSVPCEDNLSTFSHYEYRWSTEFRVSRSTYYDDGVSNLRTTRIYHAAKNYSSTMANFSVTSVQ